MTTKKNDAKKARANEKLVRAILDHAAEFGSPQTLVQVAEALRKMEPGFRGTTEHGMLTTGIDNIAEVGNLLSY